MEEEFVLKRSDIVPVASSSGWIVFVWRCPLCGKSVFNISILRALMAAKLHIERGHKLRVKVV